MFSKLYDRSLIQKEPCNIIVDVKGQTKQTTGDTDAKGIAKKETKNTTVAVNR